MSWIDFDEASALERDTLLRALPLLALDGHSSATARLDMATDQVGIAMTLTETLGPTPVGCVDLLKIRPLLFGAAWKVLDLLLEEAFVQVGVKPSLSRGFSIEQKRTL